MAVTETGHLASREVDELYRRHGGEVYRYAYAVLGNHADAEDITQTTFLNAYRSLEQGVRPRKPSNWLLTIASNAIKQRFRHEQARPHQVELDDRIAGSEVEDNGPTVGELLTALAKIPPQQRQAIVLREFEGRSYSEIAGILGVTTSALETLLFRARRSLSEELEHQLTCTDAQLGVSRAVDGRLGRKERRRLRDHLAECPDCASFARLQRQHRSALRGLLLIPIPLSLTILKGLQSPGAATAATVPATAATGAGVTALGVGGLGATSATGGGLLAGSALKAAAVIAAVSVAGGTAVGASKLEGGVPKPQSPSRASTPKPGKRVGQVAPRGVLVPGNGVARGKARAPDQNRKTIVHATHQKVASDHGRGLGHAKTSHSTATSTHGRGFQAKAHARSTSTAAHTTHRSTHAHSTATKSTKTTKATPPKQKPKKPAGQAPPAAPAPAAPAPVSTPSPPAPPPTDSTQEHSDSGNHNGADNGNVNGNGNANGNDKGK
jgi:RNA polymerase sigma factor (sigma-70 family)